MFQIVYGCVANYNSGLKQSLVSLIILWVDWACLGVFSLELLMWLYSNSIWGWRRLKAWVCWENKIACLHGCRISVVVVDWSAYPGPCCYHVVWDSNSMVASGHWTSNMVAQDSQMPCMLVKATSPLKDWPWDRHGILSIIFLFILYTDSKGGTIDSTSQWDGGQFSSITEEIRKVMRGQILASHGEDFGLCFSEYNKKPLKGFEWRMSWPNLCFTKITLTEIRQWSDYIVMNVETDQLGGFHKIRREMIMVTWVRG